MTSAHDVANYILTQRSPVTAMKLQKLVYYAQAWSLVWEEEPIFNERIEAWANGPVVPELYQIHKGFFKVHKWPQGDPTVFTKEQYDTMNGVLEFYGKMSSQALSDLTHSEDPWKIARKGVPDGKRSDREITLDAMMEYYSSLT